MKNFLRIAVQVVIWTALVAYCVFAVRHCRGEQRGEKLRAVAITVTDSDSLKIVSPETVRGWLDAAGISLEGTPVERVDTRRIIDTIASRAIIGSAEAYTEQNGTLNIIVSQRRPVARLARGDGSDVYLSADMWVMPTRTLAGEYVPVVTGNFGVPFAAGWHGRVEQPGDNEKKLRQNYIFLTKLINFVKFIERDSVWRDAFVQIDVCESVGAPEWKEPDVVLVPRKGDHTIELGTLDNAEEKLDKLALFYRNVLDYEGWDKYRRLDIRNRDQVIGRK